MMEWRPIMTHRHTITHLIFDMDGLLLDTEPFYTQATQEVAAQYGKVFEWSLKSRIMGRPAIEAARLLVAALDLPMTPEEYLLRREGTMKRLYPTAQPKPGAVTLTHQAHTMGVPLAVATSSTREIFEMKTQRHQEWFSIFKEIITGDDPDCRHGKPAPDIFLLAARRMGAEAAHCLVFEDSLSGLESALAAKMHVVAVPDPNLNRVEFGSADQVLRSLEDFSFESWGLT